jgi:hypothetical protein
MFVREIMHHAGAARSVRIDASSGSVDRSTVIMPYARARFDAGSEGPMHRSSLGKAAAGRQTFPFDLS